MIIYRHCAISEALGLQNIFELFPDFDPDVRPEKNYHVPGPFQGQKHTEEHIQNMSGDGNPMFGKTHTPEARERIAAAQRARKGHTKSEETKRRMSENAKRRKRKNLPNGKWTWYYPNESK